MAGSKSVGRKPRNRNAPREAINATTCVRRIGAHMSSSGGVHRAAERAHEIGANTFQIFTSSPRMWRPTTPKAEDCASLRTLRSKLGIGPLVVHTSYLVNVCSPSAEFVEKSVVALRGEVERALAVGAEYLVLHPGSHRGCTRAAALDLAAESIQRAIDGLPWQEAGFRILLENTAGAESSLGGTLEQVAELLERLRPLAPVNVCLDTCHIHVAGYDILSPEGYHLTMRHVENTVGAENVRVWHCNDAKAERGSKLDRHEHIGRGKIGDEPFRRLLNDPRFRHAAFIAETPVDEEGDAKRNVDRLKALAGVRQREHPSASFLHS